MKLSGTFTLLFSHLAVLPCCFGSPFQVVPSSTVANSTSVGERNIPPDFRIAIQPTTNQPINIISFYQNCMYAIRKEGAYPFYDSASVYMQYTPPPIIYVSKSESVYPHLQHSHIVWAVQRVAETLYASRLYKEVFALILVKSRTGIDTVGHLTVNQNPQDGDGALSSSSVNEASGGSTSPPGIPEDLDKTSMSRSPSTLQPNPTAPASTPPTTLTLTEDISVDLDYLPNARKLLSLNVFLTLIRAMARIAVFTATEALQGPEWHYIDTDMGVGLHLTNSPVGEGGQSVTYGETNEMLEFVAKVMIANNRFAEMEGKLYRAQSRREEFARFEVVASGMGDGEDGRKEGVEGMGGAVER